MLDLLHDKIDFSNFPEDHPRFSKVRKAMFNFVKVDTGENIIHAFLGEKKKSYQLYTDMEVSSVNNITKMERKTVKKGCPAPAASKIKNKDLLSLIQKPGILKAKFRRLQSKKHIISMIHQEKQISTSFDNSAYYKTCGLCNVPFFCSLKNIKICDSVDCRRSNLLVNIWHRVIK